MELSHGQNVGGLLPRTYHSTPVIPTPGCLSKYRDGPSLLLSSWIADKC